MGFENVPLKVHRRYWICDDCGGEMKPTGGLNRRVSPPTYPHICDRCGRRDHAEKEYPCLHYTFDD